MPLFGGAFLLTFSYNDDVKYIDSKVNINMKEKVLEHIHNDIEKKYNIILLDEYKGTGSKHTYNWKCRTCGNIFSASIRYDIPTQCKKCFPETRFQKTAQTKISRERRKIKN